MQNIKNKKGLSDVIAVVSLILIGIVAIGIVSVYVLDFASKPDLSPTINCLDLQTNQHLSLKSQCYDYSKKEAVIELFRSAQLEELNEINVVLKSESKDSKWVIGGNCEGCLLVEKGGSKKYYFDLKDEHKPESVEIYIGDCRLDSKLFDSC